MWEEEDGSFIVFDGYGKKRIGNILSLKENFSRNILVFRR